MKTVKLFLNAEDRVLSRLGDAEFHDAFGFNLDLFASGRIAAHTSGAIDQHQFAEARDGERVFGVLVSERCELFENLNGDFFGDTVFFRDCRGDLGFGQGFSHILF